MKFGDTGQMPFAANRAEGDVDPGESQNALGTFTFTFGAQRDVKCEAMLAVLMVSLP